MVRTRVGYSGGTTADPTYLSIGDHSETIEIDYDPTQVTYAELLDVYWSASDCSQPSWSPQYASRIFYHTEDQRDLVEAAKAREEARTGRTMHVSIEPYTRFYLAEDYHQKYYLQGNADMKREFEAIFSDPLDFANSTAAARVNGYIGRHGTRDQLEKELHGLGLSPEGEQTLMQLVRR